MLTVVTKENGLLVVAVTWRLASGMAHGRSWSFVAPSEAEQIGPREGLLTAYSFTAAEKHLMYVMLSANELLKHAKALYCKRSAEIELQFGDNSTS